MVLFINLAFTTSMHVQIKLSQLYDSDWHPITCYVADTAQVSIISYSRW